MTLPVVTGCGWHGGRPSTGSRPSVHKEPLTLTLPEERGAHEKV